ncbi:phosphate ABC transporter substrate-binding protein PstS [Nonomuraea sp. WAC 01424]|uniref:phosphate ABC transporter substrate-binding protein PstS n=1 Tax=Nonomuraea sp. WAC 01424 TaxID=2203200 RepID=UPI000F78FB36|nr:phosphate ABC transporter substrate-binding protein PstS [Nonomuraea sp. WAC 01424]RSN04934.1 phosphate ABC transporter substrate-binding protein PstS [Nonomuraea sp. WAC 01424]
MARLTRTAKSVLVVVLVLVAGAAAVAGAVVLSMSSEEEPAPEPVVAWLRGSGSTAQKGAMDAWISEFSRVHPELRVTYEPNGSNAGIEDFIAGRSAFAGSDVPMTPEEQARADRRCGGRAEHLPMVVAPVAVAYNLSSVPGLRLSPATLTGIFTGRVTKWNASEIAADNHARRLPGTHVHVFHRSGESGTTQNLTDFLRATGGWPYPPSRTWPGAGRGVTSSSGMTQVLQHTGDSIGYVEYGFASSARLRTAAVRNAAGEFVELSPESASKAVQGARVVGRDGDLVLAFDHRRKVPGAYPIVQVTYEIICAGRPDPLVRTFLDYTASDAGQSYLALYGYAPLPHDLLTQVRLRLGPTS